ncbi:uncharacterized protein Tco025E_07713 [Trypanosoma conorhini]|uniref:Methyltransferase domain-containing protein n=1 Tax=Trypanosoma conorhini TaxID=83891 RepID=A0A3R7LYI6_9TRYP|nr:uncharacterized protein Tco025E_07713 [Trypanosoma conorhini]RNF05820.1 hypothetical protein Tco025E_07713 [Trypanosoma conorhini]
MPSLPCLQRHSAAAVCVVSGVESRLALSTFSCSRRRASTMTAMTSEPVVCRRIYDCQKHVRGLLQETSAVFAPTARSRLRHGKAFPKRYCGARTLLELHEMSRHFVASLRATLFLPRDVVQEVDDFPMFLLSHFRRAVARAKEERPWSEGEIVEGFVDWMDMVLPASPSSGGEEEVVSFVELMRLVQSFVRYHHGVRWGGWATNTEWHRGGYLLHPWHDTYCPTSRSEQMPYVHLLQWLLRRRPAQDEEKRITDTGSRGAAGVELSARDGAMRWWGATEPFSPPSWRGEWSAGATVGFAALDCGCHSGYMTDLLLKAGAQHVVGVDVAAHALGSAEATLREHLRERRSTTSVAKTMRFIRCDLLPELESVAKEGEAEASPLMEEKNTLATAAARRRRQARHRRLPESPQASASIPAGATATEEGEVGPFDLLVFHPPMQPLLPPWPLVQESPNVFEYLPPGAEGHHPHSTLPALHRLLQQLLCSSKAQGVSHTQPRRCTTTTPLLQDGGYIAFVLPRAFDPKDILKYVSSSQSYSFNGGGYFASLSDAVTGALEGSYELVLRRRHSLAGMCDAGGDGVPRCDAVYLREFAHPQCQDRIRRELNAFYSTHQAVDLLVLRKKPVSDGSGVGARSGGDKRNESHGASSVRANRGDNPLPFDESFEYMEYIPADGPPPQHHWTAMTPTYSYLEDDFFGSNAATAGASSHKRNFLSVGHTASPVREENAEGPTANVSHAELQTLERNMQNYRSIFTGELKTRRRRRLRKMALQSVEKQEWYIDEKLVKSEGAKIDLLNELSRFDLQDWD